jgi:hypothetical protein
MGSVTLNVSLGTGMSSRAALGTIDDGVTAQPEPACPFGSLDSEYRNVGVVDPLPIGEVRECKRSSVGSDRPSIRRFSLNSHVSGRLGLHSSDTSMSRASNASSRTGVSSAGSRASSGFGRSGLLVCDGNCSSMTSTLTGIPSSDASIGLVSDPRKQEEACIVVMLAEQAWSLETAQQ